MRHMDERTDHFVACFQAFLDEVVYVQRRAAGDEPTLVGVLAEHLGADPRRLTVVAEDVPAHLFVDLDIALARAAGERSGPPVGRCRRRRAAPAQLAQRDLGVRRDAWVVPGRRRRLSQHPHRARRGTPGGLLRAAVCSPSSGRRSRCCSAPPTHYAGPQPLLFAVLEALDGLSDDANVAFLLTSNRVDVLEPALAQRPGRVDLAVEVPLPDAEARRRLIRALRPRPAVRGGRAGPGGGSLGGDHRVVRQGIGTPGGADRPRGRARCRPAAPATPRSRCRRPTAGTRKYANLSRRGRGRVGGAPRPVVPRGVFGRGMPVAGVIGAVMRPPAYRVSWSNVRVPVP
jgi:hypothetical protein